MIPYFIYSGHFSWLIHLWFKNLVVLLQVWCQLS